MNSTTYCCGTEDTCAVGKPIFGRTFTLPVFGGLSCMLVERVLLALVDWFDAVLGPFGYFGT